MLENAPGDKFASSSSARKRPRGAFGFPPLTNLTQLAKLAPTVRHALDATRTHGVRAGIHSLRGSLHMLHVGVLLRIILAIVAVYVVLQLLVIAVLTVVGQRRKQRQTTETLSHFDPPSTHIGANKLKIYSYGQNLYDDMLETIDRAQECIYFETFIWKDDAIGQEFKDRLIAKARAGIQVYVVFDVFGNLVVPRAFKQFPPEVHVLKFRPWASFWHSPSLSSFALDHRKLLIVDGHVGFLGGYNIGSLYATQWRDTHLRIIGPAAQDLAQSFVDFWNRFSPKSRRITKRHQRHFDPNIELRGNNAARLTFPIRDIYIEAFDRAQKHIFLTNAYFIPDHNLLEALTAAAERGVQTHVLLPWKSNHILADWVARSYFDKCLSAGIHIWGYEGIMIHAKTCTIDGKWTTIGTANMDRLSSAGNYEINVELYGRELAEQMEELFARDQANSFEITQEFWHKRAWYMKVSERLLAPLRIVL